MVTHLKCSPSLWMFPASFLIFIKWCNEWSISFCPVLCKTLPNFFLEQNDAQIQRWSVDWGEGDVAPFLKSPGHCFCYKMWTLKNSIIKKGHHVQIQQKCILSELDVRQQSINDHLLRFCIQNKYRGKKSLKLLLYVWNNVFPETAMQLYKNQPILLIIFTQACDDLYFYK